MVQERKEGGKGDAVPGYETGTSDQKPVGSTSRPETIEKSPGFDEESSVAERDKPNDGEAINLSTDYRYTEMEGESEEIGEDGIWNTKARFYVSTAGDFINEGVLSEPESIISASTFVEEFDLPEDQNFREWCELDPSDEEEQDELRGKFFNFFKVKEPEVTQSENDLHPEDFDWRASRSLKKLTLHNQRVTNVMFIAEQYSHITSLDISKNFVRNVRPLGKLKSLLYLNASDNEITRFLEICCRNPHPLQEVNFSKNQITEIVRFNRFLALVNINLSYNYLKVIDNFQHCYFLRFLNLAHNQLREIYKLDCPNLLVLLLQDNKLKHISGLEKCVELRYLNISRNQISDFTLLKSMPRLVQLRCADNKVDLLQTDVLKSLIYLRHLRITPNPCTELGFSREMLIFTLPQLRYLDKKLILPEEIVKAKNIFKPSFEKIAFEDHRNTALEKATQSASSMFREYCDMYPIPPMLFLVGSSKSRSEVLGLHLREKFLHRILIGGVHSTATTIEMGNHYVDIPISMEHFMEMKRRGHLFSTSTILGRLCGFSATQLTKAVEHRALLVGVSIPLETAICLQKWGFKAQMVLVMPSDAPHFNVDSFLEKEKHALSVHGDEEKPIVRDHRRISFFGQAQRDSQEVKKLRHGSILKNRESNELSNIQNDPCHDQHSEDTVELEEEDETEIDEREAKVDRIEAHELEGYRESVGREWDGEERPVTPLPPVQTTNNSSLCLFGIEIINPATIKGVDWKRTILSSDFFEGIPTMDDEFHFLVTRSSEDEPMLLSREILEDTISPLGYDLIYGPTLIYMRPNEPKNDNSLENSGSVKGELQLIVVKRKPSNTALEIQSCPELPRLRVSFQDTIPYLFCEDDGEDGVYSSYLRPSSPWYERQEFQGEVEITPDENKEENKSEDEDEDLGAGSENGNIFKHRNAMAVSILSTRDEYLKYHQENPGFFSTVLDTRNMEESKDIIEELVLEMLEEFRNDESNTKNYPLVESYAQMSPEKDAAEFTKVRIDQIKSLNNEWLRGYSNRLEHHCWTNLDEPEPAFKRVTCPRNLLCPVVPKGYNTGLMHQLKRAESIRKEKIYQDSEDAMTVSRAKNKSVCQEKWKTYFESRIGQHTRPKEATAVQNQLSVASKENFAEEPGEQRICLCGELCLCEPRRSNKFSDFKRDSLLAEIGYDGDE